MTDAGFLGHARRQHRQMKLTLRALPRMLNSLQDMNLPIACTLSTAELQERKATILASVRNAVLGRSRIPGGGTGMNLRMTPGCLGKSVEWSKWSAKAADF